MSALAADVLDDGGLGFIDELDDLVVDFVEDVVAGEYE